MMDMITLAAYWSVTAIEDNVFVCLDVFGALLLGIVVGYERTWNGRAAGMRTYGFVCMASAALTVVVGHPASWYGGHPGAGFGGDPTRVIQGIVTGIGFLGAGVIMKDGFTISGLTTAASIWTVSAIGVLVGIGFHISAMVLTVLSTIGMVLIQRIERLLPSHRELVIRLRFDASTALSDAAIPHLIGRHGYAMIEDTLAIELEGGAMDWHFMVFTRDRTAASSENLALILATVPGIKALTVSHARN